MLSFDSIELSDQSLIRERLREIRAENAEQRAKEQESVNEALQVKPEELSPKTKSDSNLAQQTFRPLRSGWYDVLQEFEVLGREDQERLGRAVEAGNNAETRLNEEVEMDTERRSRLETFVRDGLKAQEVLVLHNLRLVRKFAFYYSKKIPRVELDDVFQAGVIGLMRAAQKFDWRRGYTFSTYATWWIRQSMSREWQNNGPVIHVPIYMWSDFAPPQCDEDTWMLEEGVMETSERRTAMEALNGAASLDTVDPNVQEAWLWEGQRRFGVEPYLFERSFDAASINSALELLMEILPYRTSEILRLYYGFRFDNEQFTLERIGGIFDLTRERVRQLIEDGITLMRLAADIDEPEDGGLGKRKKKKKIRLSLEQSLYVLSPDQAEQIRFMI